MDRTAKIILAILVAVWLAELFGANDKPRAGDPCGPNHVYDYVVTGIDGAELQCGERAP